MRVSVCACVCVCNRASVRCVRACGRAYVRVYMYVHSCARVFVCMPTMSTTEILPFRVI